MAELYLDWYLILISSLVACSRCSSISTDAASWYFVIGHLWQLSYSDDATFLISIICHKLLELDHLINFTLTVTSIKVLENQQTTFQTNNHSICGFLNMLLKLLSYDWKDIWFDFSKHQRPERKSKDNFESHLPRKIFIFYSRLKVLIQKTWENS